MDLRTYGATWVPKNWPESSRTSGVKPTSFADLGHSSYLDSHRTLLDTDRNRWK